MISVTVKDRAKTILRRGEIVPVDAIKDSDGILVHVHCKILQRNKQWADVYYRFHKGLKTFSCNAVTDKKNGDKWGCPLNTCDKSVPFCSHTLALQRYVKDRLGVDI